MIDGSRFFTGYIKDCWGFGIFEAPKIEEVKCENCAERDWRYSTALSAKECFEEQIKDSEIRLEITKKYIELLKQTDPSILLHEQIYEEDEDGFLFYCDSQPVNYDKYKEFLSKWSDIENEYRQKLKESNDLHDKLLKERNDEY